MLATGLTLTAGPTRVPLGCIPKAGPGQGLRGQGRGWRGAGPALLAVPCPRLCPAAPPALVMILVVNCCLQLPPHRAWSHQGGWASFRPAVPTVFPLRKPWGRRGDSSVSTERAVGGCSSRRSPGSRPAQLSKTSYSHRESRKRAPGHGQRGVGCPGKALRGVPARRVEAESSLALW